MDPAKLKVVELRSELGSRGLDTKGNKPVLVQRLRKALEKEGKDIPETSILDTSADETLNDTLSEPDTSPPMEEEEPNKSDKSDSSTGSAATHAENAPFLTTTARVHMLEDLACVKQEKNTPEIKHTVQVKLDSTVEIKQEPHDNPTEISEMDPRNITQIKLEPEVGPDQVKQESQEPDDRANGAISQGNVVCVKIEIDEKRSHKRERSPSADVKRSLSPQVTYMENEPEIDEDAVVLDWYNSDLNLIISKENFTVAHPITEHGFGFVWCGARATYGVCKGKVAYEVKVLEHLDVRHLEKEPSPHVVRVGWSTDMNSMQLGEEPLSYGYGGTGKASTNCQFKDYGRLFEAGDVVAAYLDMEGGSVKMSYCLNGETQGVAFDIPKSSLEGKALFPHVLVKNCSFEVNFGNLDSAFFPLLEGYVLLGHLPVDERIRGTPRPKDRSDCEIIMMCGLPGCGKTTWANAYAELHPERKFNILGTNNLIDRMKVMGLNRKRNYAGRWDVLIEKCTRCLNKLLEMSTSRRRSYIIDQTNVYPTAQRRKMRGFDGFRRRAVVIVPTDDEFKNRCGKRDKEEGKDIPDSAVLEMKANFKLPEVGDVFDEVEFVELKREEAQVLVEQYNKEGKDAGFISNQNKRFKGGHDYRKEGQWGSGRRDRSADYRSNGRGSWNSSRSGGAPYRESSSNWSGGRGTRSPRPSGGGGYRQGGQRGRTSADRDYYQGSRSGQGSRPWNSSSQGSWSGQSGHTHNQAGSYGQQGGGGWRGYGEQTEYGQSGYGQQYGSTPSNWNQQYYGGSQGYYGQQTQQPYSQSYGYGQNQQGGYYGQQDYYQGGK